MASSTVRMGGRSHLNSFRYRVDLILRPLEIEPFSRLQEGLFGAATTRYNADGSPTLIGELDIPLRRKLHSSFFPSMSNHYSKASGGLCDLSAIPWP